MTGLRNIANIVREVPRTEVVFYREEDGSVPIRDWLDDQTLIVKEAEVPPREVERAVERKRRFVADPAAHTFQPEE